MMPKCGLCCWDSVSERSGDASFRRVLMGEPLVFQLSHCITPLGETCSRRCPTIPLLSSTVSQPNSAWSQVLIWPAKEAPHYKAGM
jgi:hypothetical protein